MATDAVCTHSRAARTYVLIMKTNVTFKFDSETPRRLRIIAAAEGTSISGLLASKLEELVRHRTSYERSKRHTLARLRNCTHHGFVRTASRDELHER